MLIAATGGRRLMPPIPRIDEPRTDLRRKLAARPPASIDAHRFWVPDLRFAQSGMTTKERSKFSRPSEGAARMPPIPRIDEPHAEVRPPELIRGEPRSTQARSGGFFEA